MSCSLEDLLSCTPSSACFLRVHTAAASQAGPDCPPHQPLPAPQALCSGRIQTRTPTTAPTSHPAHPERGISSHPAPVAHVCVHICSPDAPKHREAPAQARRQSLCTALWYIPSSRAAHPCFSPEAAHHDAPGGDAGVNLLRRFGQGIQQGPGWCHLRAAGGWECGAAGRRPWPQGGPQCERRLQAQAAMWAAC